MNDSTNGIAEPLKKKRGRKPGFKVKKKESPGINGDDTNFRVIFYQIGGDSYTTVLHDVDDTKIHEAAAECFAEDATIEKIFILKPVTVFEKPVMQVKIIK